MAPSSARLRAIRDTRTVRFDCARQVVEVAIDSLELEFIDVPYRHRC
jgi:hypothetical protein